MGQKNAHNDHLITGKRHCGCRACGEVFSSLSGFDGHRYGPHEARQCRTPAELVARKWTRDRVGRWQLPNRGQTWPSEFDHSTNQTSMA